nr:hypothetical protein OG999_29290 [Streptomyces sp. NBC_00886]
MTYDPMKPTVPSSAARHVQRIEERDAERDRVQAAAGADSRPTHERLAEHAIAGAQADAALRADALKRERLARGIEDDEETEPEGPRDPMDSPERRSARVAWSNATR